MNSRLLLPLGLVAVLLVAALGFWFLADDGDAPSAIDTLAAPDPQTSTPTPATPLETASSAPQALSRPARPIDAGADAEPAVTAEAWGDVTGRVVDGQELPVVDARVTAFLSAPGSPFRGRRDLDVAALTDADGRFTITGLPAGTPCGVEVVPGTGAPTLREPFTVTADETLDLGTIAVSGGVGVTGVVTDLRTGDVLRDVTVELADLTTTYRRSAGDMSGAPAFTSTTTDANGRYRFEHLAPRQYELRVARDGYIPLSSVLTFVLAMGDEPARQDFALERATERVDGTVVSAVDGSPVAGLVVRLSRNQPKANGYYVVESATDARGAFAFDGLPAGRLSLELRGERWFLPLAQPIEAPASNVVVEARPAQWVDVTLVAPGERDLPDEVTVTVKPTPGGGGALVPAAPARRVFDELDDGAFRFEGLRHGKYHLEIAADGYAVTRSQQFELLRGTDSTAVTVVLSIGATLRGRLEPPVADARVELRSSDYDPALSIESAFPTPPVHGLRTTTDADGAFELSLIPADAYVLSAFADGAPPVHVFDLELADGELRDVGALAVPEGGVVVGQVLGPDGQARAATRVLVHNDDHHSQTTTDTAGAFRLDALPPGTYEITATPGASNFWEALRFEAREQVTVTAGQTSRVTLQLTERERRG